MQIITTDESRAALSHAGYHAFAAALASAGLHTVLQEKGPFTVFAPSDRAFAMFPAGWIDRMMETKPESLRAILGYHFARGLVMSMRLRTRCIRAIMYSGESTLIDGRNGLRINGAAVVSPDNEAQNGVIHGIDRILWPRAADGPIVAGGVP